MTKKRRKRTALLNICITRILSSIFELDESVLSILFFPNAFKTKIGKNFLVLRYSAIMNQMNAKNV